MHIVIIVLIFVCLGIVGAAEYAVHRRKLHSIPIRVHVNGTRGKSSVTRLIAAGLREAGVRTFAKTTGTLPRMIIHDGTEYPIFRMSKANIIEQRRIVSFAASNKAEALVVECMALQPYLQRLCEARLISATIGVITNARPDHLDVMGPTERDVAVAILSTVPKAKVLYTCETGYIEEFNTACGEMKARLVTVDKAEIDTVSDKELFRFSYIEHRENVALALAVCSELGVDRDTALKGMIKAAPDEGALRDMRLEFFGRVIFFVNGFAANDPRSSEIIWNMANDRHPNVDSRIMIVNCRLDRTDRSRQIGGSIADWLPANRYILIGSGTYFLMKNAVMTGVDPRLIISAEDLGPESIFEEILTHCGKFTLVMGMGNIAGPGLDLVKYFKNRSELNIA
jgi:poly-gamma-glutamate synthase PgsB/CapB